MDESMEHGDIKAVLEHPAMAKARKHNALATVWICMACLGLLRLPPYDEAVFGLKANTLGFTLLAAIFLAIWAVVSQVHKMQKIHEAWEAGSQAEKTSTIQQHSLKKKYLHPKAENLKVISKRL